MVIGYHIIFGAYGFWLPNDPRGSWSDYVGSWDLFRYGPATKTTETRSLAYDKHDARLRLAAKESLKYPAVQFSGIQARAIGKGFGSYAAKSGLVVRARAILPDHVHLVIDRSRLNVPDAVVMAEGSRILFAIPWGQRLILGAAGGFIGTLAIQALLTASQKWLPNTVPPLRQGPGEFMVDLQ